MKFLPLCLLLAAGAAPTRLLAQAAGFAKLPSGTEYKLYRRDAAGRYQPRPLAPPADSAYTSREGRFLLTHVTYLTGRDSVLQSSRKQLKGQAAPIPLQPVQRKGGPEEAFALLLPGDSAVFRFRADSLFKGRPVPPELVRGGGVLVVQAAATGLVSQSAAMAIMQKFQQQAQAEAQAKAKAHAATQGPKDEAAIQEYIRQNKLTATAKKTAGGTWYVVTKRGAGALPQAGQTVSVKYRGTVLATGKEFDSSAKHGNKPFDFVLGQGQVIQGWDQGIAVLPVGSTATLLIPSSLAYGERGAGADIPADAPLRFDVELVGPVGAKATPAKPGAATKKPAAKPAAKKPAAKK